MSSILDLVKEKLNIGETYSLEVPGSINGVGVDEIRRLVNRNCDVCLPYFHEDEDFWEWKTSRGTFTKRLSNWMYKNYNIKISPEMLSEVGNLYSLNSGMDRCNTYHFNFTDRINWRAGDFGDGGSCFWGCRNGARAVIEENEGLAIRFYEYIDDDGHPRYGLARAFISPMIDEDCIMVWNGYGFTTLTIARIVAQHLGLSYKKVGLSNYGDISGLIYINGDGTGYALSDEKNIIDIHSIDLKYKVPRICCYCECEISINESIEVPDGSGNYMCEDCDAELWTKCCECEYPIYREYSYHIDGREGDFCGNCFSKYMVQCNYCGKNVDREHKDKFGKSVDTVYYCYTCYNRIYTTCPICNRIVQYTSTCTEPDTGTAICGHCFDQKWTRCRICGNVVEKSETLEHVGVLYRDRYCIPCVKKYAEGGGQFFKDMLEAYEVIMRQEEEKQLMDKLCDPNVSQFPIYYDVLIRNNNEQKNAVGDE